MAGRPNRSSLANNLMVLLILVVGVSVTVVSIFALVGVFSLARDEATARHSAYRQATIDAIGVRLDAAFEIIDRASGIVIGMTDEGLNEDALAAQFEVGGEYIDRLAVSEGPDRVLLALPSGRVVSSLPGQMLAESAVDGSARVVFAGENELWVARRVRTASRELIVSARVRTGWLKALLNGFSSGGEGRWIAVTDAVGSLVATSSVGPSVSAGSLVFEPYGEGEVGAATAVSDDGTVLAGEYSPVGDYPGLDWRVVLAEPRSAVVGATIRALTPAVAALLLSAVFSLAVGIVFSRRLVAPIRDLEAHARSAVRGGYVQQIYSDRTDELGSLADAFNEVALRLNSLRDLSQLLASSRSLDQVLNGILAAMSHILGSTRVAVYLLDEKERVLSLVACQGFDACEMQASADDESWLADALRSDEPIEFVADTATIRGLALAPGTELTGLAAALRVGRGAVGVVAVYETDRRAFTEAERAMVRAFSAQAAVAVRNSRLFEMEAAARREAETLRAAAELLVRPVGIEVAIGDVNALAREILDADWVGFAIMDRGELGIAPAADAAEETALLRVWGRLAVDENTLATVIGGLGEDDALDDFLTNRGGGELLLATATRGGLPGAVLAYMRSAARNTPFGDKERRLADGFAAQVSLALDIAYNYDRARGRAANLETIFRISQAVGSSLQIKVVLNRVLDVVQKIFSADAVSLMTIDSTTSGITTAMARGLVSQDMVRFKCAPGDDIAGAVFSSGKPQCIDDLESTVGRLARLAVRQGLHAAIAVPLLARGRSLGVLTVFATDVAIYTEEDMELLHTFASQAALAIDTAEMYSREHNVASVLQASILPESLPDFEEVETSTIYLAAGDEAEIGGDYYDMFRFPDGSIMLAIGDVCGKGVTAATKTSMIKYSVRGLAAAGLGPARVLAEVNRMVAEAGTASDIVTLWVGLLDVSRGILSYANGGHPAALLYRAADGDVDRMSPTGPLLGAVPQARYTEERTTVRRGDTILLFTDGVTEARRGDKFFGEGRVRRALSYGGDTEEVKKRLLAALERFVPGRLRDDAAVLVVRVRATAKRRAEK